MNTPPRLRPPTARAPRLAALLVVSLTGGGALGFIDPKFTPVHLVRQSQLIATGRVTAAAGTDEWTFRTLEVLKGKAPPQAVLGLSGRKADQAPAVRGVLKQNGPSPVMLFAAPVDGETHGLLHVSGTWLAAVLSDAGGWQIESPAPKMSGMYAGGTDMLVRLARYALAYEDATVPAAVGASWADPPLKVAQVDGEITGMQALALRGDGRTFLFVAAAKGDRLLAARDADEGFDDVTAASGLAARSLHFAWVDLADDGLADLVSSDGRNVRLWRRLADGTFRPAPAASTCRLKCPCLGLASCRLPGQAQPAVLASTTGLPVLLSPARDGAWTATLLPDGEVVARAGAAAAPCIVADLDNDGFWDVLQPRRRGGVLWRGGPGGPGAPVASNVTCPGDAWPAALADFDQDGFLDVFAGGARASRLWENDGKARFRDVTPGAGSLSYKAPTGLSGCRAADLNHDGRADLCLLSAQGAFTYHFNRGFRCFGEEGDLRLTGRAAAGQRACEAGDFNGDGATDLAVGFVDGQVWCYYNDAFRKRLVRVTLAAAAPGPITVSVWQRDKPAVCMGTASVSGRPAEARFCLRHAGPCTVRWSEPGKPGRARKVVLPARPPERGVEVTIGQSEKDP